MRTYLLFNFVFAIVGIVAGMIMLLCVEDWPINQSPRTLGGTVARVLISCALAGWAAYLLWG